MAVANLVKPQPDHAARVAKFAIDAVQAANTVMIQVCCDVLWTVPELLHAVVIRISQVRSGQGLQSHLPT